MTTRLPSGWTWTTLGDLGKWQGGGTPSKSIAEFWENGSIPWVSPKDMKVFEISGSADSITESAVAGSSAKLLPIGSVLVVTRSGILERTLPIAVTRVPVTVNQDLKALTPAEGIDPKFVAYGLRCFDQAIRQASAKDGTTVASIDLPRFLRFPFPLPPTIDEQRRIVESIETQLTRLDAAVAALKRAQANLKRYRAPVLKAAVEGRLVTTEAELARKEGREFESGANLLETVSRIRQFTWQQAISDVDTQLGGPKKGAKKHGSYPLPFRIPRETSAALPEGWTLATVDQLAVVVRGASPRPAGDPKYFGGTIPWITVGSITADDTPYLNKTESFVTDEGMRRSRFIPQGTFLLTNSGVTLGVPKITKIGGCINDGSVALLGLPKDIEMYLYYFLTSQTSHLRNINQGAAQPNLNTEIVKSIEVPLPPIAEQRRIADEAEKQFSALAIQMQFVEKSLRRTERLRQSILHEAFSGGLTS